MNSIVIHYHKTPFGELLLGTYQEKVVLCDWRYRKKRETIDQRIKNALNADFQEEKNELHNRLINQLEEYFLGQRKVFELPLLFIGSEFQKKVWEELMKIPYGKTCSYGVLSNRLGQTRAVRAVANANGANALSLLVPCHRVVGEKGELTGYAGGLSAKKKLLELENPITQLELEL